MALWAEFCGGFYQALSPVIAADQAINLYTETRAVAGSQKQITMYGTPGLALEATVEQLGCRGWFTQDGRTWVVVGERLYERVSPGVYTDIGYIPNDDKPVSFASNGQAGDQLGICGGSEIRVLTLSTNALTTASLPFANPVTLAFLDGYTLANQAASPVVWFSALEDMTTWDALDFFTRSGTSDDVVAIGNTKDRVWVWGSKTSTLYYDSGDADTPFIPYPGTTFQVGLVSPSLVASYSDTWFWVAESAKGQRRVVTATEPAAQTISTPPIDLFLNGCTTLDDARMLLYEQEGHTFVAVTCPSSTDPLHLTTPVFDVDERLWHFRQGWDSDTGEYTRWRAAGSTVVDGTVLVGDFESGDLYELDLETYDDNGAILMAERTAPYLGPENQWAFLEQFELGTQAGVGLSTGQGSDPQAELQISRDGAQTWVSAGFAALGAIGQYTARTIWPRLGRARLDRLVVRVRISDPVKRVLGPGAWLRVTPGTGQL